MNNINHIEWHDPHKKIWGFHVHQELPMGDFSLALLIQEQCANFLESQGIKVNSDDAIKPGYGPHLNYMWELRVENNINNPLEQIGLALSYMAVNRFGLSAYIHPLMHDPSLPEEAVLLAEGRNNQANALWFSKRVDQNQDFFFNPPRGSNNKIIDTRTSRVMSKEEKINFIRQVNKSKLKIYFLNPFKTILNGFHIHMDFTEKEKLLALAIFDNFLIFLLKIGLRPSSTRIYDPYENGPHIQSGWEVKFEAANKEILKQIGVAIGWLMCNRQNLSIFTHPVTWIEGDHQSELKAHAEYSMFIGELPLLDLNFFRKKFT